MEAGNEAAIRELQAGLSSLRRGFAGLPIRTLGFLTVLFMFQFAYMANPPGAGFSPQVAQWYTLFMVAFLAVAMASKVRLEELRLLGTLFMAMFGLVLSWAVTLGLYGVAWGFDFPEVSAVTVRGIMVMQILFVAVSEEFVFRYTLPQIFQAKFRREYRWLALLIPQVSFGLYHWAAYGGDWVSMVVAMVFGCLLMYAYYIPITGKWAAWLGPRLGLGFCIGVHAAYNLVLLGVLSGGVQMIGGG